MDKINNEGYKTVEITDPWGNKHIGYYQDQFYNLRQLANWIKERYGQYKSSQSKKNLSNTSKIPSWNYSEQYNNKSSITSPSSNSINKDSIYIRHTNHRSGLLLP